MRVLLLDVNCKYSSTGKIVYDLYTQLRADGHEAAIAYGRGPIVEGENIYRFSPVWEVYLHALLTRVTGYTGCFSYVATRRLMKYIEKFQPDVVHLHDMHGYFVNIATLVEYLKKKQIRTIWTFHCEFMYTGKCGHAHECEKWKEQCGACPHLQDYPQSVLLDRTSAMLSEKKRMFDGFTKLTIVSPSEWLAKRAKQSFLKDKEIVTIHNGIDTGLFCTQKVDALREDNGLENTKVVLAAAADLMSENKGGKEVLKIAEFMKQENVKFVLIGMPNAEQQYGENVIAIERISDQTKLAKYYSMADVFLICSKRENFPTTCIEALCCGTPIVGYDAGGTAETARGRVGRFVQYGDTKGVISAINEFFAEDREELRELCEQYGKQRYSKQHMYQEYLKIYQQYSF